MVSSSTNICPASTRWDSKISLRSSLPVCVASRAKTAHATTNLSWLMTHKTQSSTIKKTGSRYVLMMHPPHMTCIIHPMFLAKHGKTVVTSKNTVVNCGTATLELSHVVTTATACHGFPLEPPLGSDTGYYRRSTSIGRRSVHLHWTFAPIAQWHWRHHSRNMPSTMKRSVWPFLRHCRKWSHCLPNARGLIEILNWYLLMSVVPI